MLALCGGFPTQRLHTPAPHLHLPPVCLAPFPATRLSAPHLPPAPNRPPCFSTALLAPHTLTLSLSRPQRSVPITAAAPESGEVNTAKNSFPVVCVGQDEPTIIQILAHVELRNAGLRRRTWLGGVLESGGSGDGEGPKEGAQQEQANTTSTTHHVGGEASKISPLYEQLRKLKT